MWTDAEEKAFARLMELGFERMPAIRLFRRCQSNLKKALAFAEREAPTKARHKAASEAAKEKARLRREIATRTVSASGNDIVVGIETVT